MYVPIVALYTAARQGLPDRAEHLASIANDLTAIIDGLDIETAKAGDPPALVDMLKIAGEIHDGIRRGVVSLNNAAVSLEETADDYVETDAEARREFNAWESALKSMGVPQTREPVDIGNPEDPGFVIGGREVQNGASGIPRYLPPSDFTPESPSEDKTERDQHAAEDSTELGLPHDPTDDI